MVSLADDGFDRRLSAARVLGCGCLFRRRNSPISAQFHRAAASAGKRATQNILRCKTDICWASRLPNESARCVQAHEISSVIDGVIKPLRRRSFEIPIRAWRGPFALDRCEQRRCMRRMLPDAALRRRTAEPRQIIGATDGEAIRHVMIAPPHRSMCPRYNQSITTGAAYSQALIPC
jgi:hypothetical protein